MKYIKPKLQLAAALAAMSLSGAALAATVDLTTSGWVTYGDANSYALNTNNITVMSGPGQIDLFVKLGLNPPGQLNNAPLTMDDAFQTPTANPVDGFRMNSANEPGGSTSEGTWDRVGWWDATLSSLNSQLNFTKNSMVFFFANNETGNTPDLAGWARVELTKITGNVLIGRWDLTNDPTHQGNVGYGPPPVGGGVVLGDPTAYTSNGAAPFVSDFIDSGNDVCLNALNQLVACKIPDPNNVNQFIPNPAVVKTYSENLGGDRAAYAIVFPELDAAIKSLVAGGENLADYALHVDYRLGCGPEQTQAGGGFPQIPAGGHKTVCAENYALNGGDEKVFIGTQLASTDIPEPSSVVLTGLGLLGLGIRRFRALA